MNLESLMAEALDLAMRGRGAVEPNPRVGALALRDGEIVGRGWHRRYGDDHAEVDVLLQHAEYRLPAHAVKGLENHIAVLGMKVAQYLLRAADHKGWTALREGGGKKLFIAVPEEIVGFGRQYAAGSIAVIVFQIIGVDHIAPVVADLHGVNHTS